MTKLRCWLAVKLFDWSMRAVPERHSLEIIHDEDTDAVRLRCVKSGMEAGPAPTEYMQ